MECDLQFSLTTPSELKSNQVIFKKDIFLLLYIGHISFKNLKQKKGPIAPQMRQSLFVGSLELTQQKPT